MKVIILGSGTSSGVPTIGCTCPVCTSFDSRNKRNRSSIYVQKGKTSLVIDTATEFRLQMLEHHICELDGVLITHDHADHLHGLDDLRSLTWHKPMPLYGRKEVLDEIKRRFSYIFMETQKGGGKPRLELNIIDRNPFQLGEIDILPIPVWHGALDIRAYRLDNIAYVTDCNVIPEESMKHLMDLDLLIVDALRYKPHSTHFSIDQALEVIKKTRPRKALLTHFSHDVDHTELARKLPENVEPAYDGLIWEG